MSKIHFDKVVETENYKNFCGGCNNSVILKHFIVVDEEQTVTQALDELQKNRDDELFTRERFLGFCLCGKIYLYSKKDE